MLHPLPDAVEERRRIAHQDGLDGQTDAPRPPGQPATERQRGTVPTANLVSVLPQLDERGLSVKIVAALSPQLFALQDAAYREATVSASDRWGATAITNGAFKPMRDWLEGPLAAEYSLSPDWDNRWRTGGTFDEVMDEAHLSAAHIEAAIERFARERESRLSRPTDPRLPIDTGMRAD